MTPQHIVNTLLETSDRRAASIRHDILRKLDAVRKRPGLSANYAQLVTTAFGPVPSYAMEDPNSDWWSSEDAAALRQELTDMLSPHSEYGVKPGGPTHVYPGALQSWQQTDRDMR